jgi:hypothetical protein
MKLAAELLNLLNTRKADRLEGSTAQATNLQAKISKRQSVSHQVNVERNP